MTATVGIDLASRPAGTAVCAIEWDANPRVIALTCGVVDRASRTLLDDEVLLWVLRSGHGAIPGVVTKVAIDAPFGWPVAFVDTLSGASGWREGWIHLPRDGALGDLRGRLVTAFDAEGAGA